MLRKFVAAITLGLAAPALAGEGREWRPVDEATGQIRDMEGLEQLARDFPDSGTVRLRMLQPLLAAGEVEKVMGVLEWLYERGYVFSDVAQEQIPRLLEGVDPGRIAERLRGEAEVIEASEVVALRKRIDCGAKRYIADAHLRLRTIRGRHARNRPSRA